MSTRARRFRLSAYALIRKEDLVLLCRISRELPRWEGFWTLPGGGVEFGEAPESTMVREVEEETGLRVVARSVAGVDTIFDTSGEDDYHGVRIIYHADVIGGALRDEKSGTTDRSQWHQIDEATRLNLVDLAQAGLKLMERAKK
jgi:ADP-ribose pyrophosphatase YjhB (NUDIX family)